MSKSKSRYIHYLNGEQREWHELGGKAANLNALVSSGVRVPEGFVISTQAFDDFVSENGLENLIEEIIEKASSGEENLRHIAIKIMEMIKRVELSPLLRDEIEEGLKKISAPLYAVRSSATIEDMPSMSFAGMYHTFLGVLPEQVPEKVRECWASLFLPRVLSYRHQRNVLDAPFSMAVIVQRMVDAEASGVMFTVDPVTHEYLLVEMVPGTGEKLVSGKVTPNDYFISRESLEIVQQTENLEVKIEQEHLREIARIGLQIEHFFGGPQDIEFAIERGEVFILQARPITVV